MVKSRFSSLDVRAMVNSCRPEAVGCKLTNVYDINSKVYILKLARTGFKCFLLLESGTRFHLTNYQRDKSSTPSNYTMKLRKHIRQRRLTSIQQIGSDRSVDFTFGRGENSFHLILELYVSGNLILTDHEYNILTLLRTHTEKESNSRVAVRQIYPLELATGLLVVPIAELGGKIREIMDKAEGRQMKQEDEEADQEDEKAFAAKKKGESKWAKNSNKKRVDHIAMPLVSVLHKLAPWSDPQLCASMVGKAMHERDHPCENAFKANVEDLDFDEIVIVLTRAAELALDVLRSVSRPDDLGGGHMQALAEVADGEAEDLDEDDDEEEGPAASVAEGAKSGVGESTLSKVQNAWDAPVVPGWILRKHVHKPPTDPFWVNDEFSPLQPVDSADPDSFCGFPSFHLCVDEFFTRIEESKVEEVKAQHAQNVYAKVDRIRDGHTQRIGVLEAEQGEKEHMAELIEANVELVERALLMLNTMVASQVDWGELWREVKRQQRLGHPIAQHIHSLDLEHNEFKMLLGMLPSDEEFDLEDDSPMEVVSLDLSLTAHANVSRLHTKRKDAREKTSKTAAAAVVVVKQAERRAQMDLKKFEIKQTLRKVRQTWWFEKFFWFISSENYLVLAGRDANQTEQLFCKHLGPNDAFVQADVQGARSCFVKNVYGGEVPPATLREAGTMVLCHSSAWEKNMRISAWWVPADQVVRPAQGTAPESDSVIVDGFMVRGHRRFMPPLHLEMGYTVLFHVAEASAERHTGERRSRYLEAMAGETQEDKGSSDDGEGAPVELEPDSDAEELAAVAKKMMEEANAADAVEPDSDEEDEAVAAEVDVQPTSPVLEESSAAEAAAEEAQEEENDRDLASSSGGGRMSKADRRRMKKGGGAADDEPPPRPAASAAATVKSAAKAPVVLARGQKAKVKKIKDRYAEQDDEERELRLTLLGGKASKALSIAKGLPDAGANVEAAPLPTSSNSAPKSDSKAPLPKAESKADAEPAPSKGAGKRAGPTKGIQRSNGHASDEVLRPGCELDLAADLQLAQLDLLTGKPDGEDEMLYAMPMVAPYCALGGPYTFRVKLTPGPTKKGQAAKTCLRMLEASLEKPSWKPLVQAIPDNDAASLMCGTCKLSMPGMAKVHSKVKRDQKKEKQAQEKALKK